MAYDEGWMKPCGLQGSEDSDDGDDKECVLNSGSFLLWKPIHYPHVASEGRGLAGNRAFIRAEQKVRHN